MFEIQLAERNKIVVRECEDGNCVVIEHYVRGTTRAERIADAEGPQREDPWVQLDAATARLAEEQYGPEPVLEEEPIDDVHIPVQHAAAIAEAIAKIAQQISTQEDDDE